MKFGISDKGFNRIAQDQSKADFLQLIELGDLPEGWYVHAANKPLADRNTGYVTLFKEGNSYEEVLHYGEFLNFVKPGISVYVGDIEEEVMIAFREDYENDSLSPELDGYISNALEFEGEEAWESMKAQLNPSDLIGSAEWWDNEEFTSWFNQRFDYNFIVTYDGGIMFDIGVPDAELVVITSEELDSIF